ncbi:MAG: uncharacterized protein KVP18_003755 [Porospora cf. gigantea A]|uniref:uncharacterized protein n=1 Tax=Porospora cf. gigantea A TaxID=2853593 RepID=UPI00355AA8E7|nr:MAG: hypothetical protein KVP18_003755 [Porospora cf. gigantea A]
MVDYRLTKRVEAGVYSSTTGSPVYGDVDENSGRPGSNNFEFEIETIEDAVLWLKYVDSTFVPQAPRLRITVEKEGHDAQETTLDCRKFVADVRKLALKKSYNAVVDHLCAMCTLVLNLVDQKHTVYLRTSSTLQEVERKGLKALFNLFRSCGGEDVPRLDDFIYLLSYYVSKGKSISVLCMLSEFPYLFYSGPHSRGAVTSILGCGGENIVFQLEIDKAQLALRRAVTKKEFDALTKMSHFSIGGVRPFHLLPVGKHKYVMMPLMQNLEAFVRENIARGGDGTVFVDVIEDLAHQFLFMRSLDIVHCDIKPQNIMALQVEGQYAFVAGDYGSVKKAGERCNKLGGTVPYRDPFSMVGDAISEHDYWSLGISIFLLVNKLTENTNRTYRVIQEWNRDKATAWANGDRFQISDTTRWETDMHDMYLSKVDQDRYFSLPNVSFSVDLRKLVLRLCDWNPSERIQPSKILSWSRKMRKRYGLRVDRPRLMGGTF